jgi:BirA family transcriptional regulator, biotin operon repressor / biotin---[acetyl-CoA-carboxylase] ligase
MLNTDTLFVGRHAIYLQTIDSTNAYAHLLLTKTKPIDGTVIWAAEQTAGRGQIGSSWISQPSQNITASFILNPHFLKIEQQFILNQAVALALRDFLLNLNLPAERVFIKWPNDIYIDTDKVAGVLIENIIEKSNIKHSIIGIGLNINQQNFNPTLKNPSSLFLKLKKVFEIPELLSQLCRFLEYRYLQLKSQQFDTLKINYTQALFRYQQYHYFIVASTQQLIFAQILGVSPAGKLILNIENQLQEFAIKEINFVI